MNTITVNTYQFNELPENVQQKLIEKYQESNAEDDWWVSDAVDDVVEALTIMGFEIEKVRNSYGWAVYFDTYRQDFDVDGSYYYKPGAVKRLKQERPTDTDLHEAAQSLVNAQKKYFYKLWADLSYPHYYTSRISIEHSERSWDNDFPEMKDAIEEVYQWALSYLQKEYEWHTGEENAREYLEEDDSWYLINGKQAPTPSKVSTQ